VEIEDVFDEGESGADGKATDGGIHHEGHAVSIRKIQKIDLTDSSTTGAPNRM
jgi:hypothetical protein